MPNPPRLPFKIVVGLGPPGITPIGLPPTQVQLTPPSPAGNPWDKTRHTLHFDSWHFAPVIKNVIKKIKMLCQNQLSYQNLFYVKISYQNQLCYIKISYVKIKMLSKMVRVRVRVISHSNKSAGNQSRVYAVLGIHESCLATTGKGGRPRENWSV